MEDSDNSALAKMGFPPHHIDLARQITGSSDIQVLSDWLMANSLTLNEADKGETAVEQKLLEEMKSIEERHQVGDFEKMDSQAQAKTEANLETQPEKKAAYMKCNDCGKLLSSQKAMKQHSLEFNHCNFSEVEDAVAEEEKKKATENLYARIQEMAKHREEKEQRKEIEVEKERRKMGLEMADYRRRLELEEMKQMIKQRKQQKRDDYLAKKKILDEIRMEREVQQLQKNKAAFASAPSSSSLLSSSVGKMEKASTGDDLETCTLQFRMPNGRKIVKEFKKTDTWADAKVFAQSFFQSEQLEYFTTFPTRFFNEEDMSKTLLDMNRKYEINLCANGGSCFFNEHGNVQCECATGYVGKYCQTVDICMSNSCENGGSCDYRIEEDEITFFICLCPAGFTLIFCENPLPNVCDSLPCKNGICELETLDSFHCRCESGYEGKFCENFTPCKYNFCNNGGQCIVLPDATYRCSGANYIFCSGDGTTKATSCCNMTSTGGRKAYDQLNAPGPDDKTPLMVAAERCTSDVELQFMIMLLNAGAKLEAQTEFLKGTALIIAVRHSRLQAVLALINFGCSLETAYIDGNTALYHVVMSRNNDGLD
ncbi:Neurogenic locus notch -like protein 1 [Trichinella pseudospiralis]|uniref:Neurogenic locus notch-like protein 1 n=1 Tax=Trichinella pseudospiralis TaxID=6337 RepID=A0A0V1IPL5_TRIPS|nr:Neurogenic locus notch -like protein 1 [Trichinella pseudospiralis]